MKALRKPLSLFMAMLMCLGIRLNCFKSSFFALSVEMCED